MGEVSDEVGVAAARGVFSPDGILAPVVAIFDAGPVTANEPMPVGMGVISGRVAGDVVAQGGGSFSIALDFAPDGDDASCVGEGAFHGTRGQDGNSALFNAPVSFLRGAVAGFGFGKGFLDGLEQATLVAFDLQEVFASFFYDGAGCFLLVVEGKRGQKGLLMKYAG